MTGRPILGIDLGGTKIGTGLVDQEGTVLYSDCQPTLAHEGPQAVIQRIIAGAERVLDQAGLAQHGSAASASVVA
jgi:glucokinase